MFLPSRVGPRAKYKHWRQEVINSEIFLPNKDPFKSKITCKRLTSTSFASIGIGDLKLPKVRFSPYFPQQFHGEFHEHHHLWPHQIPQGANANAIGLIVREMGETKVGTKNLDWAKAGLEMTLIYSIFLAFLHAFSNVIQSRQILQIIEQLSFKFHQGQKKTQACPNHLNS